MGRFRFGGRLRGLKSKLLINKMIKMHICYKMGRLRGLKSKLLINKMIKMHIRWKMGRFRFGGRLRGLKVSCSYSQKSEIAY